MARRNTQVQFIARVALPIVLGLLFVAYVLDALFPLADPDAMGVYNGLTVVSLVLTAGLAGLLASALYARNPNWRVWAIYLGVTAAIWAAGVALHLYLPRPFTAIPAGTLAMAAAVEGLLSVCGSG